MGKRTWQRGWDRGTTGRYTHNLMPQVGKKKMMPALRGEGVAYCRLLLNSTLLLEHQKMKKIEATSTCDCNTAIEGVSHFLIECPLYNECRTQMYSEILEVWEGVRSAGHLNVTAEFLLAPEESNQMSTDAAIMVSRAVFKYIKMTKRLI